MPKMMCEGWWEQAGFGRQPMADLMIDIEDGAIRGSGNDMVGPFQIEGQLEGDRVVMRKQYTGQHLIVYQGRTDGEGVYYGEWSMSGFTGGKWSIRFRAAAESEQPAIAQIRAE